MCRVEFLVRTLEVTIVNHDRRTESRALLCVWFGLGVVKFL